MAAHLLSVASAPVSLGRYTSLPERTAILLRPSFPPPATGRKTLLGDPVLVSNGVTPPVPYVGQRKAPLAAAVLSMLPTSKGEEAISADKIPKWSARAIKSFCMAELEARKLKYPNTGTEALLMGILVEGTSLAAKFLRANGVALSKVREETTKLLGKSDMYFFSPEHPPLTEPAQRALDWALNEKQKSGDDGEVTTTHLLLGIWSEKDSAGHKILASLGFDDVKSSELAKTASKDFELNYR